MSINNIQLNPSLLAEIYKNSLVEIRMPESYEKKITDSPPAKTDVNKSNSLIKEWKYLGQYKKNILLIVRYNASPHLPDEPLNFLTSVLGACKLSLADIAVLNIAMAPSVLYKDVQEQFKAGVTILFGLTPEEFEMPVNFPEFQVQAFNHCHFLHTPTLEELESNKILKSKLWVCLKRMFSLS